MVHSEIGAVAMTLTIYTCWLTEILSRRYGRRLRHSFGWAIYAAGFVIWLFGCLSAGHASIFHWEVATPWWISSFVPNLEAELGLALMFASMIPIYGRAVRKRA
jgi:hypothetical protein